MNEEWRDIDGYVGLYQVSNLGQVRNLDKYVNAKNGSIALRKGRVMKQRNNRFGYKIVNLWKDCEMKTYSVHRIVAQAFIPNPNNHPQVNHKDENKSNNMVENLEWCDTKYNMNYGTARQRAAKKKTKPVFQLTLNGNLVTEYQSAVEAAKHIAGSNTYISACCRGKYKTAYGYIWKYKN